MVMVSALVLGACTGGSGDGLDAGPIDNGLFSYECRSHTCPNADVFENRLCEWNCATYEGEPRLRVRVVWRDDGSECIVPEVTTGPGQCPAAD